MNTGQVLNSRHAMNCTRLGGQRGLQQSQLRGMPVVGSQRNARLSGSRRGALSVRAEKVSAPRYACTKELTAPPPVQTRAGHMYLSRSGVGAQPAPSHRWSSVVAMTVNRPVALIVVFDVRVHGRYRTSLRWPVTLAPARQASVVMHCLHASLATKLHVECARPWCPV